MTMMARLPEPAQGLCRGGVGVAYDNGALLLHVDVDPAEGVTSGRNHRCDLIHVNSGVETTRSFAGLPSVPWKAQTFPNNDVLLSFWANGMKASIFTSTGELRREVDLGDYIEDIQIDALNRIWVSYFDQKDYGVPSLRCFDAEGNRLADFGQDVLDAYAINVGVHGSLMYGYTDFDLWEITPEFRVTVRTTPIQGSHAVACGSHAVLFSHQYNEDPSIAHLLRFDEQNCSHSEIVHLEKPDGEPLRTPVIMGRNNLLHFFDDGSWYYADVNGIAHTS